MDCRKFVADVHLAKLAKYLRLLGFDTLYFTSITDDALIEIAKSQQRLILTKDKALSSHPLAYLVRSQELRQQLPEVLRHCRITHCYPFSRCLIDNSLLERVEKEEIIDRLPPKVRRWCNEFWRCPKCGRIYWHGTHYRRMRKFIDEVCGEIRARYELEG